MRVGRNGHWEGAASDHILRTGYWRFALFALHGVRDIGQKTGYESARTWRGSYGCQTSVLLDSRLSALRIIETFSKRSCSLLSCIVPCLLHRIHLREEIFCNVSLQNRPFIVVTSYLITTRARSLPSPKPSHHTSIPLQYSALADINISTTQHTQRHLLSWGSSIASWSENTLHI